MRDCLPRHFDVAECYDLPANIFVLCDLRPDRGIISRIIKPAALGAIDYLTLSIVMRSSEQRGERVLLNGVSSSLDQLGRFGRARQNGEHKQLVKQCGPVDCLFRLLGDLFKVQWNRECRHLLGNSGLDVDKPMSQFFPAVLFAWYPMELCNGAA